MCKFRLQEETGSNIEDLCFADIRLLFLQPVCLIYSKSHHFGKAIEKVKVVLLGLIATCKYLIIYFVNYLFTYLLN